MMNESEFGNHIRQKLNLGLRDLSPDTLASLRKARELALSRQKQTRLKSWLATAGGFVGLDWEFSFPKQVIAVLFVFLMIMMTSLWVEDQRVKDLSDIDSALLSNDLPIAAFADKGFRAWLSQSSEE